LTAASAKPGILVTRTPASKLRGSELRQEIAAGLRKHASFLHRSASAARKPVMIIEEAINNFVFMLGYDRMTAAQRPEVPRAGRRIQAYRGSGLWEPIDGDDERLAYADSSLAWYHGRREHLGIAREARPGRRAARTPARRNC